MVADSFVGQVALQLDYRKSCFSQMASTVSIDITTESTIVGMSEITSSNNLSDVSGYQIPEGSGFSNVRRL